jgi:hypothetical protein
MESAYENNVPRVLEFALGYPKALDWHMFRPILHNVHMLDKRQENGRFYPFLYQDSLLEK